MIRAEEPMKVRVGDWMAAPGDSNLSVLTVDRVARAGDLRIRV